MEEGGEEEGGIGREEESWGEGEGCREGRESGGEGNRRFFA